MRTLSLRGAAATTALLLPLSPAFADGLFTSGWTGTYLGIDAGGGWGDVQSGLGAKRFDLSGLNAGAHFGYSMQISALVLGLEADGTLTDSGGSLAGPLGVSLGYHMDWLATLRGRAGLALGPVLAYATAGVALAQTSYKIEFNGLNVANARSTDVGFALGAGIETKIMPGVSLRLEGLQYMFGEQAFVLNGKVAGAPLVATPSIEPSYSVLRAGLSFRF